MRRRMWMIPLYLLFLAGGSLMAAPAKGPTDWSDWEKYRGQVRHPAAAIQAVDLERAKQNIQRYPWAQSYAQRLRRDAEGIAAKITPEYLARMIERTTPGCVGPCPACRAKGLPWHPNGQWSWSEENPDQLTCKICKTVFPNAGFPESIVLQSKWDPEQRFTFVGGEAFNCFGYQAHPSLTGIIRANKIGRVTSHLNTLALAYALTGEPRYARAAKAILLRFAAVLPKYLVRAGYGYGEYADTDPHVAAERISNLPEDELVTPPNKPNRSLHTGYWSASRIGSSGMDGGWVGTVAQAYDLTCTAQEGGTPIYSVEERIRIERDVLLESSYLAACDAAINNKSVGNRAGAAMVGMAVGHPGLVRFGLEGFRRTVEEWFLPDGGSSESASYAMMTMSGVRDFTPLFRDYSDPPGYQDPDGKRIDHFNACRDTRYGDCWQGLIWTLQGDLRHPPSADSYRTTWIGASFAELIALAYPTPEHLALLKEMAGVNLDGGAPGEAIFAREAGLETRATPPLSLPDVVFPFLSQGYLRTGETGRGSTLLLNASDWGNHHHFDSLDLYYWKDGRELLSDLGYLWDHPDKHQTMQTTAHNLVLIDGKDQAGKRRGGSFHLFTVTPRVKAMEASSRAYADASVYRRTVVQVDHGAAGSYAVDLFRAQGGQRRDYLFHGPGKDFQVQGLTLAAATTQAQQAAPLLANSRVAPGDAPWQITWKLGEDYAFTAFSPGGAGETVTLGDGWGQRDHRNTDRGATLPYILRTRAGTELDQFVSVFAGYPAGKPLVQGVRRLPLPADAPADAVAVAVQTSAGTDIILSLPTPKAIRVETVLGTVATDARVAVVLGARNTPRAAVFNGGTALTCGGITLSCPTGAYGGKVLGTGGERGESYFTLAGEMPQSAGVVGQTLFVEADGKRRAYPIRAVKQVDGQTRVYTKVDQTGFEAQPGETWEFLPTATWERR